MSTIAVDLQQLYFRQFGSRPVVGALEPSPVPEAFNIRGQKPTENISALGSALTADYLGKEIWLPIKFFELDAVEFGASELLLPFATIKISGSKTIVETPLAERSGTVKEQYSVNDYGINIKGFLIGYDDSRTYPIFPEKEIQTLKKLWDVNAAVRLDNALTNVFIGNDSRVVISAFDLPESQNNSKHIRPFTMSLKSDSIFTLEVE